MSQAMYCGDVSVYNYFSLVTASNDVLVTSFFDSTKTRVNAVSARIGKDPINIRVNWKALRFQTENNEGWSKTMLPMEVKGEDGTRANITLALCISEAIGKRFLITTPERMNDDFYSFLMENYDMPLLPEWMDAVRSYLCPRYVSNARLRIICEKKYENILEVHGVKACEMLAFDFRGMSEKYLEDCISTLLMRKTICITPEEQEPLNIPEEDGFNAYITHYGSSLVDNLSSMLQPYSPLKANVDIAIKEKSLFPQQAACVNGAIALHNSGIRYAILNEGMGVGKTLQGISTVEGIAVEKYRKIHPKATLEDIYRDEKALNYRAVIICPGHLVDKWKEEILAEIPYAKAEIVSSLKQLIEIRKEGRKANGKCFYIFSKDFLKLGTQMSPIPTQTKHTYASMAYCTDCYEETGRRIAMKGKYETRNCPRCHGTHSFIEKMIEHGKFYGLVCHACGELLIQNRNYSVDSVDFQDVLENSIIQPASMGVHGAGTDKCFCCGASLWGVNAKPLTLSGQIKKKSKWYRVSHFTNHACKTKKTGFVLHGHEEEYYESQVARYDDPTTGQISVVGLTELANEYGPRKTAPAQYIKKHLKGFFDFCILDEAHKYLGEGSAQAVAAHACVKASKFTLALTGTIANGTATSFFRLFYMLEPRKMLKEGYDYEAITRFVHDYGCTESSFEGKVRFDGEKNICSRGSQLRAPSVKPGISPLIVGKFMLDRTVFLDLSDLSKYLPNFREEVILCDLPGDVLRETNRVIDTLKVACRGKTGMAALSNLLEYGMSYPDKPYGRDNIKAPHVQGALLAFVSNLDMYRDRLLPKEEKLIELVNQEIGEGRNCFIYACFTGKEESNVTTRLQYLVEEHCNLRGRVQIIQSVSPKAKDREKWMHEKAAEGIKVFITNPMNVETGLDFCFKHNGVRYNYPTLIFYQMSSRLDVIWQASRRGYRLNQTEECRNFYLAYNHTLQASALSLMGKKITAVSAIQGKFSTEGLSLMAQGVDAQAELAASLSRLDEDNRESISNMFDALKATHEETGPDGYEDFVPSKTFYELLGLSKEDDITFDEKTIFDEDVSLPGSDTVALLFDDDESWATPRVKSRANPTVEVKVEVSNLFGLFDFGETNTFGSTKKRKVKKQEILEGQQTLWAF